MLHGSMIPRRVKRMVDERCEPREPAGSSTAVLEWRGRKHVVRLGNSSPSGAMVIFSAMPHIGETVTLHLLGRSPTVGTVKWVRDGRVGINFAARSE